MSLRLENGQKIADFIDSGRDWIYGLLFRIATLTWYFTSTIGESCLLPSQYVAIILFCGYNLALLLWPIHPLIKVGLLAAEGIWLLVGWLLGDWGVVKSKTVLLDPGVRGLEDGEKLLERLSTLRNKY